MESEFLFLDSILPESVFCPSIHFLVESICSAFVLRLIIIYRFCFLCWTLAANQGNVIPETNNGVLNNGKASSILDQ